MKNKFIVYTLAMIIALVGFFVGFNFLYQIIKTDVNFTGLEDAQKNEVVTLLSDQYNLHAVLERGDLFGFFRSPNKRLRKISAFPMMIRHGNLEPEEGLIIRVEIVNMCGKETRKSFSVSNGEITELVVH